MNNDGFEIEAYFIDLDGTTFDKRLKFKSKISKKNKNAIVEKNKDVPIIISTGRSFNSKIKRSMKMLGVKYSICQNGAIIGDNQNNILLDIKLDEKSLVDLVEVAKKWNLWFTINSKYLIYSDAKFLSFLRFVAPKRFKSIDKFDTKSHVNKVAFVGKKSKNILKIYNDIKDKFPNLSIKVSGHDMVIEITNKYATKGFGAKFICELLNIDPKKTIHIGDSQNDSTTIDVVGALVAMKNSSQLLLDVATHLGPNYKRGGLAKILNGEFEEINRSTNDKNNDI